MKIWMSKYEYEWIDMNEYKRIDINKKMNIYEENEYE